MALCFTSENKRTFNIENELTNSYKASTINEHVGDLIGPKREVLPRVVRLHGTVNSIRIRGCWFHPCNLYHSLAHRYVGRLHDRAVGHCGLVTICWRDKKDTRVFGKWFIRYVVLRSIVIIRKNYAIKFPTQNSVFPLE